MSRIKSNRIWSAILVTIGLLAAVVISGAAVAAPVQAEVPKADLVTRIDQRPEEMADRGPESRVLR